MKTKMTRKDTREQSQFKLNFSSKIIYRNSILPNQESIDRIQSIRSYKTCDQALSIIPFNNTRLFKELTEITDRYTDDNHINRGQAAIDKFESFVRLDNLCRLHIATKRIRGEIVIPINNVAYDDCIPSKK